MAVEELKDLTWLLSAAIIPALWWLWQLRSELKELRAAVQQRPTEKDVNTLHYNDVHRLDVDIHDLRGEFREVRAEMAGLRGDITELRSAIDRQTDILTDAIRGNQ